MKMKGSSLLSRQMTNLFATQNARMFGAFSLDEAKQAVEQRNAASLLKKVGKGEIAGSTDTELVGNVMFAMGAAEREDASLDLSEHADALEEFFRKNFRSLSVEQTMQILKPLAESDKISALEHSFWVWESLEEAVGGKVMRMNFVDCDSGDALTKEQAHIAYMAFNRQWKGSDELQVELSKRHAADNPIGTDLLHYPKMPSSEE